MIKVNDKWLRIALPLLPSLLFLYDFWLSHKGNLRANIIYVVTTLLVCEGVRYLVYRSRGWFTTPFKKAKRLAALIPSGVVYIGAVFAVSKLIRNTIAHGNSGTNSTSAGFILYVQDKKVELGLIASSLIYAFLTFLILWCIYELAYHFARLRHSEKERDRLEKEKLQAELQQLKGIINPHFLFNNLNSLSSLISENPTQAEDFLDELTKVFRYLLRNNETELTTLSEELKFIHSYYHLLQTRYGNAISLELAVDRESESYLLPPLTLQLLVENAVKHNRLHKEYPLHIGITTNKDHQLIVRNTLSARDQRIESTGIGLKSINSRYKLLHQTLPVIDKNADSFSVFLTLIRPTEIPVTRTDNTITSAAIQQTV